MTDLKYKPTIRPILLLEQQKELKSKNKKQTLMNLTNKNLQEATHITKSKFSNLKTTQLAPMISKNRLRDKIKILKLIIVKMTL